MKLDFYYSSHSIKVLAIAIEPNNETGKKMVFTCVSFRGLLKSPAPVIPERTEVENEPVKIESGITESILNKLKRTESKKAESGKTGYGYKL